MGNKLIGLLKSPTGTVHALKDGSNREGLCGFQSTESGSISYSGASHVTCKRCYPLIPSDVYGKEQ